MDRMTLTAQWRSATVRRLCCVQTVGRWKTLRRTGDARFLLVTLASSILRYRQGRLGADRIGARLKFRRCPTDQKRVPLVSHF
jgi:hypothetical protein